VRRLTAVAFLFPLAVLAAGEPASAQVLAPPLGDGEAEVGYTYKWYHRDLEPRVTPEMRWEVGSFYFRYGAYNRVTLMLEAGLWSINHQDFPTHDYTRYTVGGGVSVRVWEFQWVRLSAVGQYSEVMDYDQSKSQFHHRTRNFTAGVQGEHSLWLRKQQLSLWGALLYVYDDGRTYLYGTDSTLHFESDGNLGVGAGVDLLLFKVLGGFAHLVYADYVQARVGVLLRVSEL
jgi:hypothetical protein